MDLVKILRAIRNLRIQSNLKGNDEAIKFAVKHSKKNLIDVDDSSESSPDEASSLPDSEDEQYKT